MLKGLRLIDAYALYTANEHANRILMRLGTAKEQVSLNITS